MDFKFKDYPFTQVQDSTQTDSFGAFAPIKQDGFGNQQQSILSTGFKDNAIDSLVKVKTQNRRIPKKKLVKSYKVQESLLIVEKDTFAFLKSSINPQLTVFRIDDYYLKPSDLSQQANTISVSSIIEEIHIDSITVSDITVLDIDSSSFLVQDTSLFSSDSINIAEEIQDSIIVKTEALESVSEIAGKDTINNNSNPRENLRGDIWLMILLLGVLFLLGFIKLQYSSKLKTYTKALFSYQQFRKLFKEQNSTSLRLGILLSVVFYTNFDVLIYYSYFHFYALNHNISGLLMTGIYIAGLLSFYTIFSVINKILGHVFESTELVNEYLHNIFFLNRLLGLFLLPLLIVYPYVSPEIGSFLLWVAYVFFALSYLMRWIRGIQISFTYRLPYFYMILYLCSLEIIPLMLIFKLMLIIG
jgi:hypothetical protein